jgi:hypothetical protein
LTGIFKATAIKVNNGRTKKQGQKEKTGRGILSGGANKAAG